MSSQPVPIPDRRSLWLGAPGNDDSKRSTDEIRIIKEMTGEEVDIFLQANNIDVAAAKELRNEPPHIQLAVLERGPLRACVNPSGALVARIRDAKRGILGSTGRYGGAPPPSTLDPAANELDKFLAENRIDQAGVASIRSESLEVQKAVMARGPLINTTNPSASLMARIRTVKLDAAGLGAPAQGAAPQPAPAGRVPQAAPLALENGSGIDSSRLDEAAALAIRKLAAPAPAPAPPGPVAPGGAGGQMQEEALRAIRKLGGGAEGAAAAPIADSQDKRLQEEALKAIQALNAGS